MADFQQTGPVTTLHDLGTVDPQYLEQVLASATETYKIGLVLPVTAADMRAEPFAEMIHQLAQVHYIDSIVVVLNQAPEEADFRQALRRVSILGPAARILWIDGPRVTQLIRQLVQGGFDLDQGGKGRAVWMAFGYLLADSRLQAFVSHDCDIVGYDRQILARLCLPLAHPSLDFDFCKAYYARVTDRMYGRLARLLVTPLLRALERTLEPDELVVFLQQFRYPLSGEFAMSASLARSIRVPSGWGLEIGTLAEAFRNASPKRFCQVDLRIHYEHKHQQLSLEHPQRGLMRMAQEILTYLLHTLASRGTVFQPTHFSTLAATYLREAQDAVRQYSADALMNQLAFDRYDEEQAVEGFARLVGEVQTDWEQDVSACHAIPNWARVLNALPDFPHQLRQAVEDDRQSVAD